MLTISANGVNIKIPKAFPSHQVIKFSVMLSVCSAFRKTSIGVPTIGVITELAITVRTKNFQTLPVSPNVQSKLVIFLMVQAPARAPNVSEVATARARTSDDSEVR